MPVAKGLIAAGLICVALLCGPLRSAGLADSPDASALPDLQTTFNAALLRATGAPAKVDLGGQATLRLADDTYMIPRKQAEALLQAMQRPVPPNLLGLLMGPDGLEMAGTLRFVPAGFVDADADADALAGWTPADLLASLGATLRGINNTRGQAGLPPLGARRWIQPPRYQAATHQLTWAALIVPEDAPRDSGGDVIYNAIAFGREGYLQLAVPASMERADTALPFIAAFLNGVVFLGGKGYADTEPTDPRAPDGLAGAMGLDWLRHTPPMDWLFASDLIIPVAGGLAVIGSLCLFIYTLRYLRRAVRRG